ncbi:hypothetical protein A3Q56_04286 [Intoshia linei]|uniref:Ribosome-recycling factor, mitochondrial n=1 Tax=Intoshia linei TaxID=1819745 RepID=A0A177B1A1_9BILA|nr:hypothetical protein A3Q56_04286 [Intoshia linei]
MFKIGQILFKNAWYTNNSILICVKNFSFNHILLTKRVDLQDLIQEGTEFRDFLNVHDYHTGLRSTLEKLRDKYVSHVSLSLSTSIVYCIFFIFMSNIITVEHTKELVELARKMKNNICVNQRTVHSKYCKNLNTLKRSNKISSDTYKFATEYLKKTLDYYSKEANEMFERKKENM